MTDQELKEYHEILDILDILYFDAQQFYQWESKKKFEFGDMKRGWWTAKTKYGHLSYTTKNLSGVSRITFCYYIPQSTNKPEHIINGGRSQSGKSLSEDDLKAISYDFSFEAIPSNVIESCAYVAQWPFEDITVETSIVEDLLEGNGDEFERIDFLHNVFDDLKYWFKFDDPDLTSAGLDNFQTVEDIISYVQEHYVRD